MFESFLQEKLLEKESRNSLRSLAVSCGIDFSSNDYLGYSTSSEVLKRYKEKVPYLTSLGSSGSRLLSGHSQRHEELETRISHLFNAESALIFSSGYLLNVGLIQALASDKTVILVDELCHNSLKNGAKLSLGKILYFRHNDLDHLEERLKRNSEARCLIIIESVYSMDGDIAPLRKITTLAQSYNAGVVVDEAHGAGTMGVAGRGLVDELGLSNQVLARIVTFGKAFGAEGAVVLGSLVLKNYLINFCQSFIYTTGMSHPHLLMIEAALDQFQESKNELQDLHRKISVFSSLRGITLDTPIYAWMINDNDRAKEIAKSMRGQGFNVFPILSPTVRRGTERIRIVLHSFNKENEIGYLVDEMRRHD